MPFSCIIVSPTPQAKHHGVPTYIVGLVIGTAPLFVTVISPLSGYFVSTLGSAELTVCLCHICNFQQFYTTAFSFGTEVHTACWTVVGWRISYSLWVLSS